MDLAEITDALGRDLRPLKFSQPVKYVYNPLEYARAPYDLYLQKYGQRRREVILLGMNPGPWGMAQTGVPFGEVSAVRQWLGIEAPVGKPPVEHPRRRVVGFACRRSEVSGARLWGWARDTFGTPQCFFRRFFVANYCPLTFLEETGRNRTPDKLPAAERQAMLEACDQALRRLVEHFQPAVVVGVGKFAQQRARTALADTNISVGGMLHPSPASPLANRGWAERATRQLSDLGIEIP